MAAELYSATRPASHSRALLSSLALLAFVSTLAASMTWTRARELLGARTTVPGWAISFRPPKGFHPGDPVLTSLGSVIPFFGKTSGGNEVALIFGRFYIKSPADAASVAAYLVREQLWWPPHGGQWLLSAPVEARLGPFEAVEIHAPEAATVVRTAVLDNGVGYAVLLTVDGAPVEDSVYRVFDHTCRSIEPVDR